MSQVRTTRVRIIHLRNDHKAVMEHLEKGIHAHFASLQNTPDARPTASATPGTAFAKVNTVVPGSPADQAGLKAGDVIRSFGNVNWLNHERLSKVAETVQQNEGVR
jgi:26S proteasome non-ATPase regulatory subunit 9